MDACRIELTHDGSPTLYRPDIDEHYHSMHGALSESRYIYIDCGLKHKASSAEQRPLRVFEIGFGTGLNAVLAAMTGLDVTYSTIERYPVDNSLLESLDFGKDINRELLDSIHSAEWNKEVSITPNFTLRKIQADFTTFETEELFDVIFMDAFAPDKQPEMWSRNIIAKLSSMMAPGGVLTTYCAKGHIRRSFQSFGLEAERLPGPPNGKREILRLTKPLK